MLETKCVGNNFKMLVTVLAILVTNINYLFTLASGNNIQRCRQDPNSVTNIRKLSPTLSHQHHCHLATGSYLLSGATQTLETDRTQESLAIILCLVVILFFIISVQFARKYGRFKCKANNERNVRRKFSQLSIDLSQTSL